MGSPGRRARALAAALLATACAGAPDAASERGRLRQELEARLAAEPADPAAVRVALAFDARFDLDLYVTDPLEEAVYFANERSASGGRLVADRHCGEAGTGTRVEVVVFEAPPAGRYRVGVDHMRTCRGKARPAPFAVAFSHGGRTHWALGSVPPLVFETIVLEVTVPPAP